MVSFEWGCKSLKREVLRLADSLRMTMLVAWSVRRFEERSSRNGVLAGMRKILRKKDAAK
jgi:hypothetical protein